MNIQEVAHQYSDSLTDDQIESLYQILKETKVEDLRTLEDHQTYVELVAVLRRSLERNMRLFGQRYMDMIQSMLSVGEDGAYSNKLRFLYELIQNVDDCDYADVI